MLSLSSIIPHVKFNSQKPLSQSAQEAVKAGSDVVVVTGSQSSSKTMVEQLQEVRDTIGDFPLFIGGGVTPDNVLEQLAIADGAVVGKSIKTDNLVDANRATPLVNLVRQHKA